MPTVIGRNSAGEVVVELEMFAYGGTLRARPTALRGPLVNKTTPSAKAKAAIPRALMGNPSKPDFRPLNTNAGHLLGMQFDGLNVSENVVPMYASFNQHGPWKQVEDELAKLVKGGHGQITMQVYISYAFDDPRIPSGFSVSASNATGRTWHLTGFMPHLPPAIEHVALDEDEVNLITMRYWEMKQAGWTMDAKYPNLNLPPRGVRRHYEVLDYMAEVTGDIDNVSITNGRKFDAYQINNILTVNRVFGDGYLAPDDPGDPFAGGPLLTVAGDQGPHVDHIVSKGPMAGCNAYSNAQVLSGLGNLRKSTKRL